jgi:predicted acyl esterase
MRACQRGSIIQNLLQGLLFALSAIIVMPAQVSPVHADERVAAKIVNIKMSDGVNIAAAIYLPKNTERAPVLLAASPYRFDNDGLPAVAIYPIQELGPIAWYNEHGYAYVHMDVRGTGRSGGEYQYQSAREQRDLYEVVEWIAKQPWSSGKVGGIGQSYYARSQWFAAIQAPPHLACIAPYDGNIDTYRQSAYTGGIMGAYPDNWYNTTVRSINLRPQVGQPRELPWDYSLAIRRHPTYDAFWRERAAVDNLHKVKIPVFSIGVWGKVDLHLNGNIIGFQRVSGPKKLLVLGGANVAEAVAEYASVAFHEKYLLPFYDWCLKGEQTAYQSEPAVRYVVVNGNRIQTADAWPPKGVSYQSFYLKAGPSGSVTSLNDGQLSADKPDGSGGKTVYAYPDPGWRIGVVGPGPDGRPDPARRVLTFVTPPLERDMEVAGPIKLVLYASSTQPDTAFFVKLTDQSAQSEEERAKKIQPRARIVTKGWLMASHRAIDPAQSLENAPYYTNVNPQPIEPGKTYKFEIAVMPTAYLFKKGSRIRLELANGDSAVTDAIFSHPYNPQQNGKDTILHDAQNPSQLILPVLEGTTSAQAGN